MKAVHLNKKDDTFEEMAFLVVDSLIRKLIKDFFILLTTG